MKDEINELNIRIILLFTIILILFHSIYLTYVEKEKRLGRQILSDEEVVLQAFYNRLIILIIFVYFFIKSYNDYKLDNSFENFTSLVVTFLTLIAAIIEVLYLYNNKKPKTFSS